MNDNNAQIIDEYLRTRNWRLFGKSKGGYSIYWYENDLCKLWIRIEDDKGILIYGFEEEEIKSVVRIDYKDDILRLLDLINAYDGKMSSTYYASQLKGIISEFPNIYFYDKDKFMPLKAGDDEPLLSFT